MASASVSVEHAVPVVGDLLDSAETGRGGLAVVSGAVGGGKTRFLERVRDLARERGFHVLEAEGGRAERDLPFGLVGQLLAGVDLTPAEIERVGAALRAAPAGGEPPVASVLDLCLVLTARRGAPLLVTVDDVHHADTASLRCLLLLSRRLRAAGVVVVLAHDRHAPAGADDRRAECLRELVADQPHAVPVDLAPLTADEVAAVAGPAPVDGLAACLGLPRLLLALLADAACGAAPGDGPAYARAVADTLRRLGDPAARVAGGLAVVDGPADHILLGDLVGADADTAATALRDLTAAHLVRDGALAHPALRAAVLADPAADLAGLRARAAALLNDRGAPAVAVADHLVALGDASEPWMTGLLREAAQQAQSSGDRARAHDYLRLAHDRTGDERERAEAAVRLLGLEWQSGTPTPARRAEHVAAALSHARSGGRHTAAMLRYLMRYGAGAELTEAWAAVDAVPARGRAAADLAVTRLLTACSHPTALPGGPVPPRRRDPATAVPADPLGRAADALADVLANWADPDSLAVAEEVLREARLSAESFEQVESALLALVYAERLDAPAEVCAALLAEAEAQGADTWRARLLSWRAEIALRRGDLAGAETAARAALTAVHRQVWGTAIAEPLGVLVAATTARGDLDAAAAALAEPVPDEVFDTRHGLRYLCARGEYHRARGHVHAALGDFLVVGQLMVAWGVDAPGLAPWRLRAADAYHALGKREKARKLIDEQLTALRHRHPRVRGAAMRLRAATAEVADRPHLLRRAVDELQESGDQYELAGAQAALGEAHRACGDHRRARTVFRVAATLAEDAGAETLLRALAAEYPDDHTADPAPALPPTLLSDAEFRVAKLAAAGLTNREIAGRLYITVSTVEQHLTRVYRKLNVRGRDGLPAELCTSVAP
ncbi:helix-turn-helix transcriptional regulator [Actinokineospora spheciospongiae]|uniref:helix-turn-helix transcriptional regulator n=1 Tax=Actinokineospora spheciospongiae TaxID=909613 RepID=UPI000D8300B0|nr:LuxR family transcriptional regulator [Actinokineospora spheciospongiae]PWW59612.1 LuxR family transcriptional regulator [Actinokineospora spheciospongiae]